MRRWDDVKEEAASRVVISGVGGWHHVTQSRGAGMARQWMNGGSNGGTTLNSSGRR